MEKFYIFLACCTLNFSFVVSAGMQINGNLYMDKAKSKIYFFTFSAGHDDCPSTKIASLGCYNEGSIGLFTKSLSSDTNNTVLSCTGRCREEGFQYAAMLNGTGCSCGNLQPLSPHRQPTTDCNVDCPGDPSEKCGGAANRINAYYVEPYGELHTY